MRRATRWIGSWPFIIVLACAAGCTGGGAADDAVSDGGTGDGGAQDVGDEDGGVWDVVVDSSSSDDIGGVQDVSATDSSTTVDPGQDPGIYAYDPQLKTLDLPASSATMPQPLTVTGWVMAIPGSGAPDLVSPALIAGTFVPPKDGEQAYGLTWKATKVDDKGAFGPFGNQSNTAWLVVVPAVGSTTRVVSRVDNVWRAWAGKKRFPGDLYGHGKARVPIRLDPGVVFAARVRGGRKVRLAMEETERMLILNHRDMTPPHLRVGHDDSDWLGVPLLNLGDESAVEVRARVMEDDRWKGSQVVWPAAAPLATTHIGFRLVPKAAWTEEDKDVEVTLRLEVEGMKSAYEQTVKLPLTAADKPYRQTFRSPVDRSIQYYGVHPPKNYNPKTSYALALSLHGAGVQAIGQAKSYGAKDWLYLVAPTNRRPFGFDWEEWGHLNGLAALDDAIARFGIDTTRVYVTGHSMGGHGTWQFGVHHAGRFAVIGPSAGWDSFYTYGGSGKPSGPFARARAHSDTSSFIQNVADRGVYVIHGTADNNVPWSEGLKMHGKAAGVAKDVHKHWEKGAGHWWNGDKAEGADCVDWPPLFDLMKNRQLDPVELSFRFQSPGPWYTDRYSFARIRSAESPLQDCVVQSIFDGATVKVSTKNVRTLEIDGAALRSKGPMSIDVDGKVYQLPDGPLVIGPTDGKRPGVHGPFNQVMHRPWCWVWPDGAAEYRDFAAYLSTHWAIIGNGSACALPASALKDSIAKSHNLIHLGRTPDKAGAPVWASWDDKGVSLGGKGFDNAAMQLIWDAGDRLGAAIVAPPGKRRLLYSLVPFSSRSGMPDFIIFRETGLAAAGNFDATWHPAAAFATGL